MSRLKFDLKTRPPVVERPDKELCRICRRQASRYTCPTCNIPYCSLSCFRSEVHSECSETFYRREIETDIKSAPMKSAEERHNMLALLRKFEDEESVEEKDVLSEEDGDDLAHKLEGINLDEADPDVIWSMLSPAQRNSFSRVIRDPSSELAQQLVSSIELQQDRRKPWWEAPLPEGAEETPAASEGFGSPPQMMSIPRTLLSTMSVSESNPFLVYNILALCLAYAYVTRRIASSPLSALKTTDPDRTVAQELLSQIVPFLTDRKSTLVFKSVDNVVTYVWSKLEALSDTPSVESFSVLLSDTTTLFQPQAVAVISEDDEDNTDSLVSRSALLVISDIVALFPPAKSKHVLHKLNFYAVHLFIQNADLLRLVTEETRMARLKMQSQSLETRALNS